MTFKLRYHNIIVTGLPTPLTQVMCPMGRHFYAEKAEGRDGVNLLEGIIQSETINIVGIEKVMDYHGKQKR